jgi:hypothetical protein
VLPANANRRTVRVARASTRRSSPGRVASGGSSGDARKSAGADEGDVAEAAAGAEATDGPVAGGTPSDGGAAGGVCACTAAAATHKKADASDARRRVAGRGARGVPARFPFATIMSKIPFEARREAETAGPSRPVRVVRRWRDSS